MDEIKQVIFRFVLMLVVMGGLFWFIKNSTRVSIPPGERSMSEACFPEGSYAVSAGLTKITELKSGDSVAYFLPGDAANKRIARLVAIEGQRVAFTAKGVTVDGAAFPYKNDLDKVVVPEFKIPRGCVFVLADSPGSANDSYKNGPIPFIQVMGTVKSLK